MQATPKSPPRAHQNHLAHRASSPNQCWLTGVVDDRRIVGWRFPTAGGDPPKWSAWAEEFESQGPWPLTLILFRTFAIAKQN
ncbi:hypothetical protein TWF102_004412 [Orbilia oligospora]|uniref:Uncharacterized protein n=1 Tax=Orbilia oligospora TaxID=2813651 RepID=A0A7C8JDZ6_ORBOL|nr:hypothetical protein TWF102_004412 [Orbilia oligospora]